MLCICYVHCSLGLNKDYHFYKNFSLMSFLFVLWNKIIGVSTEGTVAALSRARTLCLQSKPICMHMLQFSEHLGPKHMASCVYIYSLKISI